MHKVIYIFLLFTSFNGFSQENSNVFTYKEFILNIIKEHPLAKSAQLQERIAKAKLTNARGGFDPILTSQIDKKDFDDKNYYKVFKNKITIPTPIGVNITGGFENNSGYYLNSSDNTSGAGLWSAGLEVDVLQGLFTNQRRTVLKQAKVYQEIAKNKQQQMLNELIFNASVAYAEWQQYTTSYNVIKRNLELNKQYLNNVKISFVNGEKTAMDTLEANVYLQNSQIELVKYQQLLLEKKLKVENHMWFNDQTIALRKNMVPHTNLLSIAPTQKEFNYKLDSLPVIAEKIGKRQVLELDRKLSREKLKPKLKLKYNQLLSTETEVFDPELDYDNFKWGAKLEIPLLNRSARGKYRQSKFKIKDIDYEIAYKKTEITNKISIFEQKQQALLRQINMLEKNVEGYNLLLNAENTRFKLGESSLFLINKRQEKLIESEIKLIKSENQLMVNYLDYLLITNNILPAN